MSRPFFVYGTLKEGGRLAGQFDHLRKHSEPAALKGFDLYRLGWFPGILRGDGTVFGEIHEYNRDVTDYMDTVEGYRPENEKQSLFIRREVRVETEGGPVVAFVYIFNHGIPAGAEKIEDGVWPI
jgi:gamma-glutamylcyclotransferase (GGCT)/AIG2-like uncharacterized protein YtfP